MAKDKTLRVDKETLARLHRRLADLIAKTGNTKLSLGDVIARLLNETEKDEGKKNERKQD